MISCAEALSRLYEYLDGELEGVTPGDVEEHFRICAHCYPHLRLERALEQALLRAVERQQPTPPALRERVLQSIRE